MKKEIFKSEFAIDENGNFTYSCDGNINAITGQMLAIVSEIKRVLSEVPADRIRGN